GHGERMPSQQVQPPSLKMAPGRQRQLRPRGGVRGLKLRQQVPSHELRILLEALRETLILLLMIPAIALLLQRDMSSLT
ncbi:hypothetical protein PMAYCL1PPCAC_05131, partial [Pristionchus mayeri]